MKVNMKKVSEPWRREKGEPAQWFHRLDAYFRPLGPERTIEEAWRRWKAAEAKVRKSKRPSVHWYKASDKWRWKERAEAWDASERRKRIAVEEEARAEMLKRHTRQAQALQSIGSMRLQLFDRKRLDRMEPDERVKELKELKLSEARHYVQDGTALERQARGLPEHLIAVTQMKDDDLLGYINGLLAETSGGPGGSEGEGPETTSQGEDKTD